MAIQRGEKSSTRTDILEQLVQAQNVGRHAYFFVSGEGIEMPNGAEEESGYVLDEQGHIFSFWLGWDARRGKPVLETWERVEMEPHWLDEPEYRQALAAVNRA
jgi:hypothetical protein